MTSTKTLQGLTPTVGRTAPRLLRAVRRSPSPFQGEPSLKSKQRDPMLNDTIAIAITAVIALLVFYFSYQIGKM